MWMYRTLASRYHQTHLYLARLYHQKYKIESMRISLSHSSFSSRIHSCLTSKPIISNILSLNIKIRPTQKYNFSCEADFFAYIQYFGRTNRFSTTSATSWIVLRKPVFCKMFFTWYLTVFGDIYNTAAISS